MVLFSYDISDTESFINKIREQGINQFITRNGYYANMLGLKNEPILYKLLESPSVHFPDADEKGVSVWFQDNTWFIECK